MQRDNDTDVLSIYNGLWWYRPLYIPCVNNYNYYKSFLLLPTVDTASSERKYVLVKFINIASSFVFHTHS